ncbi:MAG: TfoX/Sxy family protein [Propionibacteriaceae bacterium]|jgi:DNA transformation protein|nr:TfoX/Sxy family protein [Propionibacteriaceae bacterium]
MEALTDLPEIGSVTAQQLVSVGITTAEQLRHLGAKEAFERIRTNLDPGACIQLLYGLESAVEGVPARALSPDTKAELRQWKAQLNSLKV